MFWYYTLFFHNLCPLLQLCTNKEQVCVCLVSTMPCPAHVAMFYLRESHHYQTLYCGLNWSGLQFGVNLRVLYQGCRVDGVTMFKHVVCFLLGNSPASEFYMPTFRNTKFRCRGITQKKTYNIQNMAKVWNQECSVIFGDGFQSLQTCVRPCIIMLKHICWIRVRLNSFETLLSSVSLVSHHHIHKNHSFSIPWDSAHDLPCSHTLYASNLPWRLRMVPFHGLPFFSSSKWWPQVSSEVAIGNKKVSPPSSKHANDSQEAVFLTVWCSNVRLQGAHLEHTFKHPRSWMMWLTLLLLVERLSTSCW